MLAWRMGLKSLLHDRGTLTFTALALAAVLGPLLLLLGMKNGILGALIEQMQSNVANYEVVVIGDHSLPPADFRAIAELPHVGFAVPMIRSIAAHLEFEKRGGGRRLAAASQPTATGDTLAPGGPWVVGETDVALSAPLAERLGVDVGDRLVGRNRRTSGSEREEITFDFVVRAVVSRDLEQRDRAYVTLPVLSDLEAFLDGFALPARGIAGTPLETRVLAYASFRIYADRLDNVAAIEDALRGRGFDTRSNRAEIGNILSLDRNLTRLFLLIAAVGLTSYFVCLAASLAASLARNRRQLSLFKLFGASGRSLLAYAFAQCLGVVTLGAALSVLFYALMREVIDLLFAGSLPGDRSLLRLDDGDWATIGLVTLGGAALIAFGLANVLSRIPPSEVLRNEV